MPYTTPYDTSVNPPAAVIKVEISSPSSQETSRSIKGLIDTGASISVIPERIASELGLPLRGQKNVGDFKGHFTICPIYSANISLPNLRTHLVRVVGIKGEDALVGRDILNQYKMILDGQKKSLEIG